MYVITAMSHRRERAPPLPETLEAPDAGFMAAAGAYVAAVLVAGSITVAAAVSASAATVVGSIPSAATVGLIAGGIVSSFVTGLPERLGRRRRRLAVTFVPSVAFAAVALGALSLSSLPQPVAIGTGVGAIVTLIAALAVAFMARTRYARAMTPEEPAATIPLLNPDRGLHWIGVGVGCLGVVGAVILATSDLSRASSVWAISMWGLIALYQGAMLRLGFRRADREDWSDRLPGSGWFASAVDVQWLPELRIHETGFVVERPIRQRFVSWTAVDGVRSNPDELVIERRRGFDVRCHRAVIEDADRVQREIERVRTVDETASTPLGRRRTDDRDRSR